ncbi:MAG: bZIP transcription factor [Sedimentisphaerales bacterium]|nr:bZIP transcription factor [Sedimentisphaerales bacterium]
MRTVAFVLCGLLMVTLMGCDAMSSNDRPVWQSNKKLVQEKTEIENKLNALEAENKQLKQQVETLGSLDKNIRMENLYEIQSITVVGSTGIYTKEKGQKPQLMVYFAPIDKHGDSIKASGSVEVQLWNIADKANEALINQWQVGPGTLKKDWGIALMNSFYRLALDLPDNMPEKGDFVVRISFTDYLSGKVLTARQTINKMNL